MPRSPQWTDLHEILHGGSSHGHNHPFQILCRSVEGFRICAESNFAILPLLSRSPLTQSWRYRAACDYMRLSYDCFRVSFCTCLIIRCPKPAHNVCVIHRLHDRANIEQTSPRMFVLHFHVLHFHVVHFQRLPHILMILRCLTFAV